MKMESGVKYLILYLLLLLFCFVLRGGEEGGFGSGQLTCFMFILKVHLPISGIAHATIPGSLGEGGTLYFKQLLFPFRLLRLIS